MPDELPGNKQTLIGIKEALRNHPQLLFITFIVAACSIVYELLIAHSLALLAANAVVWYSSVIGCYLLGMGLGALIVDRFESRAGFQSQEQPWRNLIPVEYLLSIAGFLAVSLLHVAHSLYALLDFHGYTNTGLVLFFGVALTHTMLIGTLTGIELPLLISAGNSSDSSKKLTNAVLAFDYFGSLVGAVSFPMLLLPFFSTLVIGTIVASVNLGAAVIISRKVYQWSFLPRSFTLAALLVVVYTTTLLFQGDIDQFFLKRYYCYRLLSRSLHHYLSLGSEYPPVLRVRSPYQTIDLLHDLEGDGTNPFVQAFTSKFSRNPDWPRNRLLYLNGDWQFHSNHEEVYHEWFAHVPIMSSGKTPHKVLVLGGGDGLLIRELLRYPDIASITHVDLDQKLIELSRTNPVLLRLNNGSLLDPRVNRIIDDGMQFVRNSKEKFDAIYIDFPTPTDYDLAKLYSREFYTLVRRRLSPSGFMVFDSVSTGSLKAPDQAGNQYLQENNFWLNYYYTLMAAGFTRIIPYNSTLGYSNEDAVHLAETSYPREEAIRRVNNYVRQRQQGFIMAGLPATFFGAPYRRPPGEPLYALNEQRYYLATVVKYPMPEEIDYTQVNSIFRPVLPLMPVWNARLPF